MGFQKASSYLSRYQLLDLINVSTSLLSYIICHIVCKQVVHSKCQQKNTLHPCGNVVRTNSGEGKIFSALKRTPSFRKAPTQPNLSLIEGENRMSLKDFNQYMRNSVLPPFPLTPLENQSTLEALFSWSKDSIDKNDDVDEERQKLFITLYDSDTSIACALYQSFSSQSQVTITDDTIPVYVKRILPKVKKNKKNKKPPPSPREPEEEEEAELKPRKRNRKLLSSIGGGRKKERSDIKDSVKHNILPQTGNFELLDCIVVPCTPGGDLAIANSPETTQFFDTYVYLNTTTSKYI